MNDRAYFGETLHTLSFSEVVHVLNILCGYKFVVLTINEDHISKRLQKILTDDNNNSLRVDDAAKIVRARHLGRPEPRPRIDAACHGVLSGH